MLGPPPPTTHAPQPIAQSHNISSILQLNHLTKRFDTFTAVDDLSLDIAAGEFLTFLGASGSGKTTTLRMIAGFERPTSGEILMEGTSITPLPPFKRDINTVFQSYALFPHMSVRDNVGYGLRMKGVAKPEIAKRVEEALQMVQLGHLGERAPRQLSGGQQQRVALARALVNRPRVLLLDEPLGALDLKLRKEMQLELKQLNKRLGITFIYVTHDQEEALTMSDRIALMRNGKIEQLSGPREMYEEPVSRYVADFIGETNLLAATAARRLGGSAARLTIAGRDFEANATPSWVEGKPAWLAVRPEHVYPSNGDGQGGLPVTVVDAVFTGVITRVHTTIEGGGNLVLHWPVERTVPERGATLTVTWPPERGRCVGD
ncbi:MAG TPA: ABC transporter ATP-binding protein [Gemmatimonadales bacterium]|jgi:spermidine/putrescine transport system ATP-binding protein